MRIGRMLVRFAPSFSVCINDCITYPRLLWLLLSQIISGSSWPGQRTVDVNWPAVVRTFSGDRGCLAYSNWMTTLTGQSWPGGWVPMASMVTMLLSSARVASSSGMAVFSFDFSAVARCSSTNPAPAV